MSWALTQESDLVLPAGAFLDVKGRRQENIPSWIIRHFIHFQKVMGESKKTGCFFRLSIWSGQLHDLGQSTSHFQTSVPLRSHAALTLYTFNSRGLFMEGRKCRICQVIPAPHLPDGALWKGRQMTLLSGTSVLGKRKTLIWRVC